MNWLLRLIGIHLLNTLAMRFGAWLSLIIKRAKNKELREKLENAKTDEEIKALAHDALDRLSDDP